MVVVAISAENLQHDSMVYIGSGRERARWVKIDR